MGPLGIFCPQHSWCNVEDTLNLESISSVLSKFEFVGFLCSEDVEASARFFFLLLLLLPAMSELLLRIQCFDCFCLTISGDIFRQKSNQLNHQVMALAKNRWP